MFVEMMQNIDRIAGIAQHSVQFVFKNKEERDLWLARLGGDHYVEKQVRG